MDLLITPEKVCTLNWWEKLFADKQCSIVHPDMWDISITSTDAEVISHWKKRETFQEFYLFLLTNTYDCFFFHLIQYWFFFLNCLCLPTARRKEASYTLLKREGNDLVKKGQFQEAQQKYSECLTIKPEECALYTNRYASNNQRGRSIQIIRYSTLSTSPASKNI